MDQITDMVEQNALVIFSKSSCCMCYAMKTFFTDLGANAFVYELDHNGPVERALIRLLGCNPPVPAVFVGGQLVGTTKHVNALHLQGKLIPMLISAGIIWFAHPDQL
ncbi:hypothetical protein AAC387_Pa09g1483 [Persea americana]|eukprot:TRINITY_DN91504_c0_g1_i1.p1 TRINITY_DN91504_c0_g1~~TRINITY_DN91504_c0_g1_i1.p1  ORF type:complete len:107 (+),score=9.79 TRINITY_DN91504_c0_g1_i1:110-430(+)